MQDFSYTADVNSGHVFVKCRRAIAILLGSYRNIENYSCSYDIIDGAVFKIFENGRWLLLALSLHLQKGRHSIYTYSFDKLVLEVFPLSFYVEELVTQTPLLRGS